MADAAAGRRDRRAAGTADPTTTDHTPWARRLDATWQENDQRLFAAITDRLAPRTEALRNRFGEVERLDRELVDLRARLDAVPAPEVIAGGAETHLSPQQVAIRRARDHAAATGAVQARIDRGRAQQSDALNECLRLRASLEEEFELAREVSDRLRWYYTRRLQTYARALRVAHSSVQGDKTPWEMASVAWPSRPCPWVPAGLDTRLGAVVETPSLAEITIGRKE